MRLHRGTILQTFAALVLLALTWTFLRGLSVLSRDSSIVSTNSAEDSSIPQKVHYVFGMTRDFGGKPFSLIHYLSIRSAFTHLSPSKIYVHFLHEPTGLYWDLAQPMITRRKLKSPTNRIFNISIEHPAHQSDVARLLILIKEGGIYLDSDALIFQPFPKAWYDKDFVIGQEGVNASSGLGNSIMMSKQNATFPRLWLGSYRNFTNSLWAHHSIQLPKWLWKSHPGLVHVVGHDRFLYPLWTKEGLKEAYVKNNFTFGVGRQVAWHAWSHVAWDPYLRNLTVESIQKADTSFKRAVLPFLPPTMVP